MFPPSLDDLVDLGATWTLILDGVDAELTRATDKPELDSSVDCESWATKFGTQDIGEADIWCDAGRAYECIELADDTGARPTCSGSPPSTDTYGVWALLRAEASEQGVSTSDMKALEDDYFGAGPEFTEGEKFCVEDLTFGEDGPWKGFDKYCNIKEEGSCAKDGIPCTTDPELARRAFNAQVTPSGALPSDPTDWPRNVFIANDALNANALEDVLAGAGYTDEIDREGIAQVF